jgi:hypothetical protein
MVSGPAAKSVLAYESVFPGGRRAIALVNTGASPARHVEVRPFKALSGRLRTWTYSTGAPRIVTGTAGTGSVTLPGESIRVMETD